MKKLYIFASLVLAAGVVLLPSKALAAAANFYVSPSSSSLTKGDKITVKVRISSGTNRVDTAQAKLSFDSSRLQYVSTSGGAFSEFSKSTTSSSVTYVGVKYGSYTTGDQVLFSVTLKSIKSGTASLSLSGVQAAYAGSNHSVSASGGSVSVKDPVSSAPKAPSSDTAVEENEAPASDSEESNEPAEATDTTGPKLKSGPTFDKSEGTITMKFATNEKSKGSVSYAVDGSKDKKKVEISEFKTEHEVRLGADQPLRPGTPYKLELSLKDEAGNASNSSYTVRTKGVVYKVKVVDAAGQLLKNHPVELHSDPIKATTDENGIAIFEDVTPGEHTLVFDIEGIAVRNPVMVGSTITPLDSSDAASTVILPFRLGVAASQKSQSPLPWLLGGLIAGVLLIKLPLRKIAVKLVQSFKRFQITPKKSN